jgi:hypothetical protein
MWTCIVPTRAWLMSCAMHLSARDHRTLAGPILLLSVCITRAVFKTDIPGNLQPAAAVFEQGV